MDALVAVDGATNANAYCTLLEATTYNDNNIAGATWALADTPTKTRAILTATRLIDEHYDFRGVASTYTQALQWPRATLEDAKGAPLDYTVVPQKVKDATAEFARQLLTGDRTADNDVVVQGIKRVNVAGAVEVEFVDTALIGSSVIPDAVTRMLSLWGVKRTSQTGRFLQRT